jgi:signal transduction histidine kinase
MERSNDSVNVIIDLQTDGEARYAGNIEQHLYRITQEACENAIRHANAANIKVSGWLHPHKIILNIEDDGAGFDAGPQLDLDTLLANKHFGLAGIMERAMLINAKVEINSAPNAGTRIKIEWNDLSDKR